MNLVDIDNILVALLLNTVHNLFDAVLKVAAILRTSQQRSNVKLINATTLQAFRHTPLLYHPRQSPDKGRLAHTGLTHMQRIVLVAPTKHLDGALQLLLTAYQRIVLLVKVVHTGHQPSPGFLMFALTRFFFQMILKLIATDQLTHEAALLVAQHILQQITGPRLLQLQDTHHEMRQIQRLRTAVDHLSTSYLDHLSHLCRCFRLIALTLRYGFHLLQLFFQSLCECLYRIEIVENPAEAIFVGQHQQQVFRHNELMSVFLAAVHRVFQHSACPFRLFYLCHMISKFFWFNSQSKWETSLARHRRSLPHLRDRHVIAVDAHHGLV